MMIAIALGIQDVTVENVNAILDLKKMMLLVLVSQYLDVDSLFTQWRIIPCLPCLGLIHPSQNFLIFQDFSFI